ncbi:Lrp/AsnC family transcriptional regulator [Pedobacter sp. JY14-1]|uniref:Lrp/AsnC family transcriptional regulator n=1 Tax=Pedobacter sp. JY14-1 TaxID=3034151 RepID=UPI0023E15398|nr:Lrp/AsnC family transcriptional regulator [Pedobacter sp. JY14-1]
MSTQYLDQTDREILKLLQQDAKLTSKEIAAKLRRRPSTIFTRFNRLKNLGYIKDSVTLIDREKLTGLMIVFINVQLADHSSGALTVFQEQIRVHQEVMECYHTTGQIDFVLKIVVQDMLAYKEFLIQKLSKMTNVQAYTSHFVINEAKRELAYPLENI